MTPSSSPLRTKLGAEFQPVPEFNIPVELDLHEPNDARIHAFIRRVTTGFFHIVSPVHLQRESRLDMFAGRVPLPLEVVFCKANDAGDYTAGVRLIIGERAAVRREPRIPLDLPAKLMMPGVREPLTARVIDMSRSGLGIRVPQAIELGLGVSVELNAGVAFGLVRHCTPLMKEWRVGLCLEEFIAAPSDHNRHSRFKSASLSTPYSLHALLDRITSFRKTR